MRKDKKIKKKKVEKKSPPSRRNSFGIFWLGCSQNEYDAHRISRFFINQGYQRKECSQANIIIILACSVRQTAVDRIWGKLRLWIKKGKKIYIAGCVLPTDKKKFNAKYPRLVILSTEDLIKKLPIFIKPNPQKSPPAKGSDSFADGLINSNENKRARQKYPQNHAFVPIQTGCDNFCTYCAVPFTRGREKSRPLTAIIREIKQLIKNGKSYITLLGQNVNSYGLTRRQKIKNIQALRQITGDKLLLENEKQHIKSNPGSSFATLLNQCEKIPGLKKLDFLSPNPQDMTADVIAWLKDSKKFSGRLNLPLQSGSDKILQKMNRRYTAAQYLRLVEKIKQTLPDIELSTDVIVGFPGETKKDFTKTFDLCKKIGFKQIFIGKYSPRLGTVAQRFFEDNISWQEKKRRWEKIDSLI